MSEPASHGPPAEMLTFILDHVESRFAPRLGRLLVQGRPPVPTPTYVASTSRGIIPHVTQDLVRKHTSIPAVYVGLEDFIERSRQNAPIFKIPDTEQQLLRSFVGLHEQCVTILGPRRVPCVPSAQPNTPSSLGISTSFGFDSLEVEDYLHATRLMKPDISISIADRFVAERISKKRIAKSIDRTHAWLRDTLSFGNTRPMTLASILPLEQEQQSLYLTDLSNEYASQVQGLCLYQPETSACIPAAVDNKVRMCLDTPKGPHEVLHAIALGIDMITAPFVTSASEAGIAFGFSFAQSTATDPNSPAQAKQPLGIDMWSVDHATDLSGLKHECQCYACTRHHRAYIHHLLQAREMLAWTLLQIHNFHVIDSFFAQIRRAIGNGTFKVDCKAFDQVYEREIPVQTGEGPRVRGYQMRSEGGGEPRKNAKAYGRLDEQARKLEEAESVVPTLTADADSKALEEHGFAEKLR